VLIARIMHRAVGVSALVGIFAVLAFGTLYGILGVFIAIPMTAVILRALRQQGRIRLRARGSRMGITPATADHVADAVDQQIEKAGVQVERIISAAEETSEPLAAKERAAIVGKLEGATEDVENAVERVETVIAANAHSQARLGDLERAAQHFEDAVHDASTKAPVRRVPSWDGARRAPDRALLPALQWAPLRPCTPAALSSYLRDLPIGA
jgi:hypothetical protein